MLLDLSWRNDRKTSRDKGDSNREPRHGPGGKLRLECNWRSENYVEMAKGRKVAREPVTLNLEVGVVLRCVRGVH